MSIPIAARAWACPGFWISSTNSASRRLFSFPSVLTTPAVPSGASSGRVSSRKRRAPVSSVPTGCAAGWQANALSLAAYDDAGLLYASDTRGTHAFFPRANGIVFKTLQIPTTLPTLDELLGRPEHPEERLGEQYLSWLRPGQLNALTAHAEIEGMIKIDLFSALLAQAQKRDGHFCGLDDLARELLRERDRIPVGELIQGEVDGRSGTLAVQKAA